MVNTTSWSGYNAGQDLVGNNNTSPRRRQGKSANINDTIILGSGTGKERLRINEQQALLFGTTAHDDKFQVRFRSGGVGKDMELNQGFFIGGAGKGDDSNCVNIGTDCDGQQLR